MRKVLKGAGLVFIILVLFSACCAAFSDSEEDVVVEEGDYIALTLGGNLCKLEFMEEIKD